MSFTCGVSLIWGCLLEGFHCSFQASVTGTRYSSWHSAFPFCNSNELIFTGLQLADCNFFGSLTASSPCLQHLFV